MAIWIPACAGITKKNKFPDGTKYWYPGKNSMVTATLITVVLAALISGAVLWITAPEGELPPLGLCAVLTAPMCWIMLHLVRGPMDTALQSFAGSDVWLPWLRSAWAPLTEEPVKLWPLLLPSVRNRVTRENFIRFAIALGCGFAFGEVFTVAQLISERTPEVAAMPWYLLSGMISERLMTFCIHSGMTAIALGVWKHRAGITVGLFLAMIAHFLANFPIVMARRGWFGTDTETPLLIVYFWTISCTLLSAAGLYVEYQRSGNRTPAGKQIYGTTICPGCKREFERSLIAGVNLGIDLRYERCPHCGQWHWTRRRKPVESSS